jgi:hypothetical protein
MAISRPVLLALLGVVLLGATVLAVQNARTASDGAAAPAALQAQPAPAPAPADTTPATPQQTLESAFELGKLESAQFAAKLVFDGGSQDSSFAVSGAFEGGAVKDIPKFDVDARITTAGGERIVGGFVSLGDKAFFTRGDAGWRVPGEIWDPLAQAVAGSGTGAQQQPLPLDLRPETWVRDVKSAGTETVAGVETTHVSAQVDTAAIVRDLAGLAGGQLPNAGAVKRQVKGAELDVWVGTDDNIVRRVSAQATLAGGRIDFDLRLSDVNEPQQIEAPANVRAGAPDGVFGQLAQGLATGLSGASRSQPVSLAALTSAKPRKAARAVRDHRKVVILFRNPRGLDDRAMTSVMRNVDGRTNALVLTDHVDAVERYGKLVEDLGVSQTPSIVIIDRTGQARLIEGYVDSQTLSQAVADAR